MQGFQDSGALDATPSTVRLDLLLRPPLALCAAHHNLSEGRRRALGQQRHEGEGDAPRSKLKQRGDQEGGGTISKASSLAWHNLSRLPRGGDHALDGKGAPWREYIMFM